MLQTANATLQKVIVHHVGNKTNNQNIILSKSELDIDAERVGELLLRYFLKPFTNAEFHSFTFSNGNINLNPIFNYVFEIFENQKSFQKQSENMATHLFEIATHPQIKDGDLFVAYFNDMDIDGKTMDAIGIFKSENRQAFLKLDNSSNHFSINCNEGINVEKLDKGCLILNTDNENGYKVCVIDNTNKSNDAQYWKEDFLNVRTCNDEYHNTKDYLTLAKSFIHKQLPNEYEVTKTEQIDLLNRSLQYFRDEDEFDSNEFNEKVMQDPQVIESFNEYKKQYQEINDIELSDGFEISGAAVKKQARTFKSVLKLDKNFHIYIHGDKNLIEKGQEKDGRKFYKIYFDEEL